MVTGKIHSFETFGLVDGPGVRSVVFMQGCPMRCRFCHNPETWDVHTGEEKTADEVFKFLLHYKPYWRNNGGVTVSGGEPLMQIDFVTELFTLLKTRRVDTALDTSGAVFNDDPDWMARFEKLMNVTDLVILDLKEFDNEKHVSLTGHTNENILKMAKWLSEHGKDMWIRHVLVPGLTDDEEGLAAMNDFIKSLKTVKKVEVLPYHTLGIFKWENLGIPYSLEGVRPPSAEQKARAEEILCVKDYKH
ncbi:MAG: pyruvate formate lyase-activating protein [Clostridia bacterium]|nr:pyruvate formate lyase-activating protein [Clostridia bacterium]